MKITSFKLLFFISLMTAALSLYGQSKSDKLFDAFQNKPGVTYFAFNKNMQDAFNIDLGDEDKKITGDIHEIRFLSYNPDKGNLSGPDFYKKATQMLPGSYKKMDIEQDENDAIIWMLGNNKKASEFHVFINNDSSAGMHFLVSFFGEFDINDVEGIKTIGLSFSSND